MSTHLHRRAGGTYYFRRVVPDSVRPLVGGRREWFKSLGTKNRTEAKRLIPSYVITTDRLIVWAERGGGDGECPSPFPDAGPVGLDPIVEPERSNGVHPTSLLTILESYSAEQRMKPGTASEWKAMIRKLIAFVGHDDAARLRTSDIDRWRDHLLNERDGEGCARAPVTVRTKYLTSIRATLNWAVEKRLIPNNVAAGVVVRVPKRVLLRQRDLTEEEVKTILRASLKAPSASLRREHALARRWIPWLCAYTGARVNEISQLRKEDIFLQDGYQVLRITPDAGTVKGKAARIIPIHPNLAKQGFPSVIDSLPLGPIFYRTDRMRKPGLANRYIKKVGEHLRDWVRNDLGITDPNVQPNHGWRHRFKSTMIDLGVAERVADSIQGHAPRTVGQTYGTVSLAAMAEAIGRMPVPSLD